MVPPRPSDRPVPHRHFETSTLSAIIVEPGDLMTSAADLADRHRAPVGPPTPPSKAATGREGGHSGAGAPTPSPADALEVGHQRLPAPSPRGGGDILCEVAPSGERPQV